MSVDKKKKKKFKETKVGQFLLGKSGLIDSIGDVLPDKGLLGVVKKMINADPDIPPQDKETALKLLEMDIMEMESTTRRWESDMKSDSWLSKNTRPLVLIYLTIATTLYIVLDALEIPFNISDVWVELLRTLLVTIYVAYFGSRGFEKYKAISK